MIIPCDSVDPRPFKFIEGEKRKDLIEWDKNVYCLNTTVLKFENDYDHANNTSFELNIGPCQQHLLPTGKICKTKS